MVVSSPALLEGPVFRLLALSGILLSVAEASVLLNPGFEVPAVTGGDLFGAGGWVVFGGGTYTTNLSPHSGLNAFKTFGDVSGAFQEFPASPGQVWEGGVWALNPAFDPMVGGQIAAVNIEWRDSADSLISYDSTLLLTASSPTGFGSSDYIFGDVRGVAPDGTTAARFVLIAGAFAGPGGGAPRFDDASFAQVPEPSPVLLIAVGLVLIVIFPSGVQEWNGKSLSPADAPMESVAQSGPWTWTLRADEPLRIVHRLTGAARGIEQTSGGWRFRDDRASSFAARAPPFRSKPATASGTSMKSPPAAATANSGGPRVRRTPAFPMEAQPTPAASGK